MDDLKDFRLTDIKTTSQTHRSIKKVSVKYYDKPSYKVNPKLLEGLSEIIQVRL